MTKGSSLVVVMTPEKLFGTEMSVGLIEHLRKMHTDSRSLSLIAIDEVHMIHQWGGSFRSAFDCLAELKFIFPDVPIMALTATLPPSFEDRLITEVLREPFTTGS